MTHDRVILSTRTTVYATPIPTRPLASVLRATSAPLVHTAVTCVAIL